MTASADRRLIAATANVSETTTARRALAETMSCPTTVTSVVVVLNAEALKKSFPTVTTDRLLDHVAADPKARTTTTDGIFETPRYVMKTLLVDAYANIVTL